MTYVDGFVVPAPKAKVKDYQKIARLAGKVWREHGALEYFEFIGDDVPVGKLTSFTRAVKLKPNETVVFSYIVYKSRAQRDKVGQQEGDERSAPRQDDESQGHAVRHQAHDLRRLQAAGEGVEIVLKAPILCSPGVM